MHVFVVLLSIHFVRASVSLADQDNSLELPNHHPEELDHYLKSFSSKSRARRGLLGVLERIPADKWTMPEATPLSSLLSGSYAMQNPSPSPSPPPPTPSPPPSPPPEPPMSESDEIGGKKCALFKGDGCRKFHSQIPSPVLAAPRGNKTCPNNCSNVGVCDYDIGVCMCTAGWSGSNCSVPQPRPCTNRYRNRNDPDPFQVVGHIDPETKEDLNWTEGGWLASRCGGYCDDTIGMCYCGRDSKHRRIPPPRGSPLGTKPIQDGRAMVEPCKPSEDGRGGKTNWGKHTLALLYGPGGWCNADNETQLVNVSAGECGCGLEGRYDMCSKQLPTFCVNQCSGRGECQYGFCMCQHGWYGSDCSRKRAGEKVETLDWASIPNQFKETIRINPSALLASAEVSPGLIMSFMSDLISVLSGRSRHHKLQCEKS